jgi:hypothetical protein
MGSVGYLKMSREVLTRKVKSLWKFTNLGQRRIGILSPLVLRQVPIAALLNNYLPHRVGRYAWLTVDQHYIAHRDERQAKVIGNSCH